MVSEIFEEFIKGDLGAQGYSQHGVTAFRRSKSTNPVSLELRCTALLILKVSIDE